MPEKHKKLSDVINDTNFVFKQKVNTFSEAYPTVNKLRVEVYESEGLSGEKLNATMSETSFSHSVNCSNPVCYGGGVEVGNIIHEMVRKKLMEHEETKDCRGYEGSPKGKKKYRSCLQTFRIKAHLEYRSE
jgi:hypothetical protein